jgi:hypothetical protein
MDAAPWRLCPKNYGEARDRLVLIEASPYKNKYLQEQLFMGLVRYDGGYCPDRSGSP